MCEIFSTSKDYSEFYKNVCNKCKVDVFSCKIAGKLMNSYYNPGKFPTDLVHRKDSKWLCDDFERGNHG